MGRPFEFSAWNKFQDQPLAHPGKIYDRADNEGTSHCPTGGPAPYGRVLVRGLSAHPATIADQPNAAFAPTDRYYTKVDTCSLPDKNGAYLKTATGATYAAEALTLPVDVNGNLIVLGIGMWTEHGACANRLLEQPFGLGDYFYQPETCGQVGIATEGRIWAYCETDIHVGDALFFRTVVPPANLTDGVTLLGGFSNVGGGNFQPFTMGKVFRPGPAGGAFVLSLNGQQ